MELGEFATNVLSINNFATIHYDYFEYKPPSSTATRAQLRKIETSWRQEGILVHCDPLRDGIWRFRNASVATDSQRSPGSSDNIEVQGIALSLSEHGVYESANLGRSKQATANNLHTPSNSSSPSSSLESSIRNAQAINTRAVQTNANQGLIHEPPTPSPGTKSTFSPGDSLSLKGIHEKFISAVLGSIVYFLCRDHGYVPLNARTLIVRTENMGDVQEGYTTPKFGVTIATLHISLTSLGTLVVKAHSDSAPGFRRFINTPSPSKGTCDLGRGTALWLAPGGHAAKLYGKLEGNQMPSGIGFTSLPMSPVDQLQHSLSSSGVRSWKSNCLDFLSGQGFNPSTLDNGGWMLVQILRGNSVYPSSDRQGMAILEEFNVVPWPALLCFQTCRPGHHDFGMANFPGSYDPLPFAEEWFTGKDDRSKSLLRRQKERQMAEASNKEQADADSRTLLSNNFSSHALRRGSNTGAIYPTPPDAVHHPVGATPSFDGTVSTPGNPHQLFGHDVDTAATNASGTAETGVWGSSDSRQELTKPSVQFSDNDPENDNLFGEIGGDLFGETDITDADFSFFDEPDAVPAAQISGAPAVNSDAKISENSHELNLMLENLRGNGHEESDVEMRDSDIAPNQACNDEGVAMPKEVVTDNVELQETRNGKFISFKTPLIPPAYVSPPFTKEAVFKMLFKGSPEETRSQSSTSISKYPRRASAFNKVDVETSSEKFNAKYGMHGRFNYSEINNPQRLGPADLPKTEYLQRRRKSKTRGHQTPRFAQILSQDGVGDFDVAEIEEADVLMDSEGTSPSSEQDETGGMADDLTVSLKPGIKRKFDMEKSEGDEMSTSFKTLAVERDVLVGTPQSTACSPFSILDIDPADWSLSPYVTSQRPDVQPTILTDGEYMAAAQILADQAVSSTLKLPGFLGEERPSHSHDPSVAREVLQNLMNAAKACLSNVTTCTMRSFLEIQGIPVSNQGLRLPPRPTPHPKGPNFVDSMRPSNPFPLHIPRVEVRRSESNLTILPAGVCFWDNLGLGPSPGPKDINAICVYPKFEGLAENASTFLGEMKSTYESHRFGNHDTVTSKDIVDGVLPLPVDSQQTSQIYTLSIVKETMAHLSKVLLLTAPSAHEKNFVVYFIYPTNNAGLLVHICSAFDHLFNLYRRGLSEKKAALSTELVLQLIPLDFVASSTSLVVPKPSEYSRLAMEVYDRCIEFSTCSSTPAILLERPLPKSIDFKLNANPSPSLLSENSCLHIAYAQSIDDRWITAAWTDNRGSKQMTASYCLGRKNEPISMTFSDVAHEIWETTLGVISHKKVHWRLMIAKVGVMDPAETEFWTGLASTESEAQINLTLVTINTDPPLQLLPEPMKISLAASALQPVLTPVSTPQAASIVSPDNAPTPVRDHVTNPATPSEAPLEPDSDARLVDLTDQSWGAVLAHRLNNSRSLLDFNPALISGYLIKRGGTNNSDAPVILEVNVIHSDIIVGNPRTFHEGLLREILNYYRALATLARIRGVTDGVKDGRPWHVAAAEKAVTALYMLM